MRKVRLYLYPHRNPEILAQHGYPDCVPFSPEGIERHCEMVEPQDAEMFYCGQFNQDTKWLLHPNRFEYLRGNEARHVFDLEGDHSADIPDWLRPCVMTAMNALPQHGEWNVMVRPACSKLLMDMLKRQIEYIPPTKEGFYFRGQRDPHGLREKVQRALKLAGVPHLFEFTDQWHGPTEATDAVVTGYEQELKDWSWILCPGGVRNMMTTRFYEACAVGRVPLAISYNIWFEYAPHYECSPDSSVDELASWFRIMSRDYLTDRNEASKRYFDLFVRAYFKDPTAYFLGWMKRKGLIKWT